MSGSLPRRSTNRAITLLELMIALCVVFIAIVGMTNLCIFITQQVNIYFERGTMYSQMNYALEDMRLRCMSASMIEKDYKFYPYDTSETRVKRKFCFFGEPDIYNITPVFNETLVRAQKTYYCYESGSEGFRLVSRLPNGHEESDILVEKRFNPDVSFEFDHDFPVNFMRVNITLESQIERRLMKKNKSFLAGLSGKVSKLQGVRFWYVNVVKPKY
jgi:hypothetical protein